MADKTLTRVQGGSTDTIHINTDKFAGVRTMTKSDPALSKNSTRMQLTYNPSGGDTDGLSGIYVRATSGDGESNAQVTWNQQGGNGKLFADEIRPVGSGDYVSWIFKDTSDDDPEESTFSTAAAHTLPWQDVDQFENVDISFAPVTETLTVDRTASVIDSDRAGESRPILSKVVGGAAVAYSLRDLNDKQGNNKVVNVRRSSDNTNRDFLAKEVSNGTLQNWVNTDDSPYTQTSDLTIDAGSNVTFMLPSYTKANIVGHTFKVSFELKRNSGGSGTTSNPSGVSFKNNSTWNYTTITKSSNLTEMPNRFEINTASETYQTYSFTATTEAGSNDGVLRFRTYDSDDSYTVRNATIEIVGANGYVETWYDQSGNGSDATQDTIDKQPKIVDSGSLVTGGIDFLSDTDTHLDTTNTDICDVSQLSIFTVLTPHISNSQVVAFSCGSAVANSTGYGGWKVNLNGYSDLANLQTQAKGNTSVSYLSLDVTSSECLLSYVATFPNATGSVNGGTAVTKSDMVTPSNPSTSRKLFRIGCQYTFQENGLYTKPIKEIIIFTTDQSANRPAIEANIKNQYNLT